MLMPPLVDAVRNKITVGDWNIEVNLVHRKANVYANILAKHGHNLQIGVVVYDRLPPFSSQGVNGDSYGTYKPRIVYL